MTVMTLQISTVKLEQGYDAALHKAVIAAIPAHGYPGTDA
jgi:hypothetical protein